MSIEMDATVYLTPPRSDVASGIALAIALIQSAPPGTPPAVRKSLESLRAAAVALQDTWRAKELAAGSAVDVRPLDAAIDNAWGALHQRLTAYARLPADRFPDAARASALLAMLFPDGLGFLNLDFIAEWAESKKRLERLDEDGQAAEVERLAGPQFLTHLRQAHVAYGQGLGLTEGAAPRPSDVNLSPPLRALSRAIQSYSLQVIASVDVGDEGWRAVATKALRPLDEYRERGREATPKEVATADAKIPEVPA